MCVCVSASVCYITACKYGGECGPTNNTDPYKQICRENREAVPALQTSDVVYSLDSSLQALGNRQPSINYSR